MSAIFHTLSRAQLATASDGLDMNNKAAFGLHPSFVAGNVNVVGQHHGHHHHRANGASVGVGGGGNGGYSPVNTSPYGRSSQDPMRRQISSSSFFGFDDGSRFLGSADALSLAEVKHVPVSVSEHVQAVQNMQNIKMDPHGMYSVGHHSGSRLQGPSHHSMDGGGMEFYHHDGLAAFTNSSMGFGTDHNGTHVHPLHQSLYQHSAFGSMAAHSSMSAHNLSHMTAAAVSSSSSMHDADSDPRELEQFAETFKQRRVKLGVTQADVGKALANLKIAGVGSLSQSTICRFESLTLSHNNMVALKPVLHAWLDQAEKEAKIRAKEGSPGSESSALSGDKKRKRTSIAAPEKRRLEFFFASQPRPSGEKIAGIADQLELKKNVVRVWFCNQRQKQKRMKFAAVQHR
ncbi:Inhibitory POU protein [Hypsibius exemplaris]|uniref:POU domain protein n=1 Tax=Hypsibius exemplaris TaxID=2072580 RepID=A0A1W0WZ79_HYPEX|nr:Inhibitory POU protein [Hypsibius exemplaris]